MPHELHEQIEHAGHAGHDGSRLPQFIGITVAILGVVMALCSAQVGAARTELIATMVEENGAKTRYLSVSNKYRSLSAQLQQIHAAMPDPKYVEKTNNELKTEMAQVKNPETMHEIKVSELETSKVLNTVTPTDTDVKRFLVLIKRTRGEAEVAKEWSESFEDAVQAHSNTAERFEVALLCAEIGIVIASVGLLLAKRVRFAVAAFAIAVVLGVMSIGIGTATKIINSQTLRHADEEIKATEGHYMSLNREKQDIVEDEELEKDIEDNMDKLTAGQ